MFNQKLFSFSGRCIISGFGVLKLILGKDLKDEDFFSIQGKRPLSEDMIDSKQNKKSGTENCLSQQVVVGSGGLGRFLQFLLREMDFHYELDHTLI